MNALELSDDLEGAKLVILRLNDMLLQQQAEIKDLKNANRFIRNFAQEQHQRVVALEMRELTDEEIWEIAQPYGDLAWQDCTLDFARAILRKAQEK